MKFTVNESNKVKHRKKSAGLYQYRYIYLFQHYSFQLRSEGTEGITPLSVAPLSGQGGIDQPSVITAACRPPSYGRAQRT